MSGDQQSAREFWRTMRWIVVTGVLMVAGSLIYLHWMGAWSVHAVIATVLGVFLSVLLGCGLFALAFYSDKSGHDEDVSRTTSRQEDKTDRPHGTD